MADITPDDVAATIAGVHWTNNAGEITGQQELGVVSSLLALARLNYNAIAALTTALAKVQTLPDDVVRRIGNQSGPEVDLSIDSIPGLAQMRRLAVALLVFDFTAGTPSAAVAFSGGAGGYAYNSSGVYTATSAPRISTQNGTRGVLIEKATTNLVTNNSNIGAAAGTPGTFPTNWAFVGPGLTANVTGVATINGVPTTTIRVTGTPTSSTFGFTFSTVTEIPSGAVGGKFAFGLNVGITTAGTGLAGITSHRLVLNERNGAGTNVSTNVGANTGPVPTTTSTARASNYFTTTAATITNVQPYYRASCTIGAAIDCEYVISLVQVEAGTLATSAVLTSGATASRAADVVSFYVQEGVEKLYFTYDDPTIPVQSVDLLPGYFTVDPTILTGSNVTNIAGKQYLYALGI